MQGQGTYPSFHILSADKSSTSFFGRKEEIDAPSSTAKTFISLPEGKKDSSRRRQWRQR